MKRVQLALSIAAVALIAVIVLAAVIRPLLPYLLAIVFLVGILRLATRSR